MPEYLATFRNAEGKKVTESLEAGSADEAVALLREQGYEEIVLHTDDVMAHYSSPSKFAETLTPREFLWLRYLPSSVAIFLPVCLKSYQQTWILDLFLLALLLYRRSIGTAWGVLDTFAAAILALPLFGAFLFQLLPAASKRNQKLMEAVSWGRWEEVLARIDQVGGTVPKEEVAFRKAGALAGLGRLDEAVHLVQPFSDGSAMPEWLYYSRLAEVYSAAQRYEDASALMDKALQLAPDNATILIDIAMSEVWRRRNPGRARELLARAHQHALSDVLQPFATYTEGLIQLEEGHPHEAWRLVEEAYKGIAPLRHASPLVGMVQDKMHAVLALAAAGMGEMESARHHFRLARPRLDALKLDWVIARCEKAIGDHEPI